MKRITIQNDVNVVLYCSMLALFLLFACQSHKGSNIPKVDESQIFLKIIRVDSLVHSNLEDTTIVKLIMNEYPSLYEILFGHLIGKSVEPGDALASLAAFRQIDATQNIYRLIDSAYREITTLEVDYRKALAYYQYHFPMRGTPDIFFIQSNLAVANFLFSREDGRDALGISLDFFLGDSYPYKALAQENPAFSEYNSRTFNKDHLVSKSVNALVEDILPQPASIRMLDLMIREGKRYFILDQLLPHLPDSVVFEYTPGQLDWCRDNEREIWTFLTEKDLVFNTDVSTINKYILPAPSSRGMPEESPGRTAGWIGYQIVQAYMDRNPGMTLSELIQTTDPNVILNDSKYRPERH